MVSPSAMACWMRATARSMSFIRRGERVSFRSRSSFSAAASGVVTPRAASTEASSQEYPAERRVSTALRSASPMFHFLYFTRVPLPIGAEESKARFHPRF